VKLYLKKMNINRDNYESFFLLYVDKELSETDRKAVETFVQANPDLQEEFLQLQGFTFQAEEGLVFQDKEALLKPEPQNGTVTITPENCEAFFVLYTDNELTNEAKVAVESFVYHNPRFESDFELIRHAVVSPDTSIAFENKKRLFRKENDDDKIIPFRWWKPAAAAAVLLTVAALLWINHRNTIENNRLAFGDASKKTVLALPETAAPPLSGTITPEEKVSRPAASASKEQTENNETTRLLADNSTKNNTGNRQNKPFTQQYNAAPVTAINIQPVAALPEINENNKQLIQTDRIKPSPLAVTGQPANSQPPKILITAESTPNIVYADYNAAADEVAVLNTAVDRQNAFRGLLRKASRFIARKTGRNDDEKRKGILIGGLEIAVR
jgi:hypothetical protein